MKKFLFNAAVISCLALGSVACSSEKTTTTDSTSPKQEQKKAVSNAEEVVKELKSSGLQIGNTLVFTSETDPNKMLGRPGQYTSKVNFVDTRVKVKGNSQSIEVENGGSVEMFANEGDAKKRFEYVSNIAKSSPMFSEYDYLEGKILLRVSKELTPEQAKAYEDSLKKISK